LGVVLYLPVLLSMESDTSTKEPIKSSFHLVRPWPEDKLVWNADSRVGIEAYPFHKLPFVKPRREGWSLLEDLEVVFKAVS
jgi:hypothetical protein